MKRSILIISILSVILFVYSCNFFGENDEYIDPGFEDMIDMTIYDYIVDSTDNQCSSFLQILESGGIDKTLSAYNPDEDGYTLFLPDNDAIDRFIEDNDQFNSLSDLLNNKEYVEAFSRFHVVNKAYEVNEFPYGAFSEPTLSEDYLTVTYVIEVDTTYCKINNQAPVFKSDIEASNGFIHLISEALTPVTFTSYNWFELNDGYSIFKSAVDATGFKDQINFNLKDEDEDWFPVTILAEHDSIYNKEDIYSFDDLAGLISPESNDYTNELNPLYNFVGYHVISGDYYLDDFEGNATNYTTLSDVPLNINGNGLELKINKGKCVFDTIIEGLDSTFIDYIGFDYDYSNVITQSGAIHFIDRVMQQQSASRAISTYQFFEEIIINEYNDEIGTYEIDDPELLDYITWEGVDLFYIKEDEESTAWNDDYLLMDGDFSIKYTTPKLVQGKYTVYLGAHGYSSDNALVEVFIDDKKIGSLIDLSTGGEDSDPFEKYELGTIDFIKYSEHVIEIKTLIPGILMWDYIRFEPY